MTSWQSLVSAIGDSSAADYRSWAAATERRLLRARKCALDVSDGHKFDLIASNAIAKAGSGAQIANATERDTSGQRIARGQPRVCW